MKKSFFLTVDDGRKLEVVVEPNRVLGKQPTVILVPGLHSDLHEYGLFDDINQRLVGSGFQVYRFSFSGSGKSTGSVTASP